MVRGSEMNRMNGDRGFDIFNYGLFSLILLLMIYPLYWVVIASVSNPNLVTSGDVWLYPREISLAGYEKILQYDQVWLGYRNALIYMVLGTVINVALTLSAGYALSRKDLAGNGLIMMAITFTMFFNGGLIPTYLVVRGLGIENTIWAMVLPGAVSAFNLIITRTFFQTNIPGELLESAKLDHCKNIRFFFSIALPLSVPIIAVIVIFSAVAHWNSYFPALIYLRDESKYPLQLILRNILILETVDAAVIDPTFSKNLDEKRRIAEQVKYGVIIVSSLPVLVLYPLLQKYFLKGILIGSVKG